VLTIPRWRGFNLTDLLSKTATASFREADFEWIAAWGFNFVRLPLSYWNWAEPHDWFNIRERALRPLDKAIRWGERYGTHVNLCLHRVPGYCVNDADQEPFQLFADDATERAKALDGARFHWRTLAERYRGIPSSRLSFDLLNEPPWMKDSTRYEHVIRELVAAIRAVDPDRLIFANGANLGQTALPGLADLHLVQSTRGYLPKAVSHYTATWVPPAEFESDGVPEWPMIDRSGILWNREHLRSVLISEWASLGELGIPVHVGEWGCYSSTPHPVALAWMADLLTLWSETGWGWALWNLRGPFGVIDSGRKDVRYERYRWHRLDRRMLELLRAS
jgi:endoglucanase